MPRRSDTLPDPEALAQSDAPRARRRLRPLVRAAGHVEPGGVGQHRLAVQPRHHCQHGRAVHAPRQEHAVRHVAALVQVHAALQRPVEPVQRLVLGGGLRAALRQGRDPSALHHVAARDAQRLAGQHALDAREDRLGAARELKLQQLLPRGWADRAPHQPCGEQRLRLGGEG